MERRQYLGAAAAGLAVGVVGVGGYTVLSGDAGGPPPVAESAYPPYPEANEIERSGDGPTTSEPFQLENDGPTIVRADHDDSVAADVPFNMTLASTTSPATRTVVRLTGGYVGSTVVTSQAKPQSVPPGEYELAVTGTSAQDPGSWEATVYDIPDYDDQGLSVPLAYNDVLNFVIGPINFGAESMFGFTFSLDADTESNLYLIDSEGNFRQLLLKAPTAGDYDGTFPGGGVGYIAIDSNTEWTFNLEQSDEPLPSSNETRTQSDESNTTTQSTAETNTTQSS